MLPRAVFSEGDAARPITASQPPGAHARLASITSQRWRGRSSFTTKLPLDLRVHHKRRVTPNFPDYKSGWSEFLKHLKERGLKGVRLIISVRNIFSHVPSTKVREIAAMLKAIHASEDIAAAREKATRVIEKLRGLRLSRAAELVEAAIEETLAYYAFPEEHWRRIRTNNPLERILREIRRRTRVVGAFPDGQSALNLAAARLRHIAGTAWSTKRYLNIELLKDQMKGAITA